MSGQLLIDNSAWSRFLDPSLPDPRTVEIAEGFRLGSMVASLPFLLEAGFSARNASEHADLREGLLALPFAPIDDEAEDRALDAQVQLARAGHHRIPPVDVLIASIADCQALGVLHYDSDFDVILEKTDLEFHSEWLMPRGSL